MRFYELLNEEFDLVGARSCALYHYLCWKLDTFIRESFDRDLEGLHLVVAPTEGSGWYRNVFFMTLRVDDDAPGFIFKHNFEDRELFVDHFKDVIVNALHGVGLSLMSIDWSVFDRGDSYLEVRTSGAIQWSNLMPFKEQIKKYAGVWYAHGQPSSDVYDDLYQMFDYLRKAE